MDSDFGTSSGSVGLLSQVTEYITMRTILIVALIIVVAFLYYKSTTNKQPTEPGQPAQPVADATSVLTDLEKSGAVVVNK